MNRKTEESGARVLQDEQAAGVRRLPFVGSLLRSGRAQSDISEGRMAGQTLRRDALYRRGLAAADVLSATVVPLLGVVVLGHDRLRWAFVATVPLVILVSKLAGLYDRDEHLLKKTTLDEAPGIFQVAALYALVVFLARDFLVKGILTHEQVLGLWGLLFLSMLIGRTLARRVARAISPPERCLALGDQSAAEELIRRLQAAHAVKAEIVGRVGTSAPEDLEELSAVVRQSEIDRVIFSPQTSDSEQILESIRRAKSLGVRISVLPRLFEVVGSSVEFDDIDGVTLLGVRRHGLGRSSQALKRATDLVGAGLGLALLGPLLLMLALAVRLSSGAPALLRESRVGRHGQRFEMLKFRTVVERRVGSFLRGTSLDELPQLVNVLRGEMSLVGPRPLMVAEDRRVSGWQRRRLSLRPGMTGLWQIFGSPRVPLEEMVKIDYLYGSTWSLWLDLKVLLRTVPHVFARRGV